MTITFNLFEMTWLIPSVISLFILFVAWRNSDRRPSYGSYQKLGTAVTNAFTYGIAFIVILLVWLLWAFVTIFTK